jgi:hypothetical protein
MLRRKKLGLGTFSLALLVCAPPPAAVAQRGQAGCASAKQCLSAALSLYNNDDITDNAARQFENVIRRHGQTPEAEAARYYLASYYQRKYYIQIDRVRRADPELLRAAGGHYHAYIKEHSYAGSGKWLTDAHFNLALAYLQLDDRGGADDILSRMLSAASRDGETYVYQIVWSQDSDDVIDANMNAHALANYARTLVQPGKGGSRSFGDVVTTLRKWCQSRKSKG